MTVYEAHITAENRVASGGNKGYSVLQFQPLMKLVTYNAYSLTSYQRPSKNVVCNSGSKELLAVGTAVGG
jgi:hypothetical protein